MENKPHSFVSTIGSVDFRKKKKSYFSKRQLKLRTIVAFYLDLLLRCYHAYAQ